MLADNVDSGARRVLEVFLETARNSLLDYFDESSLAFLQRPVFNASVATGKAGRPQFRFQPGCGLALYDAFLSLISHPDFFPEVPLDLSSIVVGPDRDDRFCDYTWIASSPPPAEQVFLPKRMTLDASRYGLGDHLFEMAVTFILYHEQMHWLLGHLRLARSRSRGFALQEIPERLPDEITPELLRALELEADGNAAAVLFQRGRIAAERGNAHWEGLRTPLDWDRALLVAIGVVFMVVELNERRMAAGPAPRTHPSAAARTLNIFRLHDHMARPEAKGDRTAEVFAMQRVLGDLAVASELIGVLPMGPKDFLALSFAGAEETAAFQECERDRGELNRLLPALQRFKEEAAAEAGYTVPELPRVESTRQYEDVGWLIPLSYLKKLKA